MSPPLHLWLRPPGTLNPIFLSFPSSLTLIRSALKRRCVALIEYVLPPNPAAAPCCVSVLWTGHWSRCTRCYVFINTSSFCSPEKLCVHFISAWTGSRLRLLAWLPQTKVAVFREQAAGTLKSLVITLYSFVNPSCCCRSETKTVVIRCLHFISRHFCFALYVLFCLLFFPQQDLNQVKNSVSFSITTGEIQVSSSKQVFHVFYGLEVSFAPQF